MLNKEILSNILPEDKILALEKFIPDYVNDPNVLGIFLTGSFVHGDPGPNADLDTWIVLEKSKTRTRANVFIDGHEIEYFINPVNQIEQYFIEDFPNKINTAHMFANSVVLYEKGPELQRLITLAKSYLSKPLPDVFEFDIYSCRYFLDDLRKDLLDALAADDKVSFELVSGEIVQELIRNFGKFNKFYPAKPKRLMPQLNLIDQVFSEKLKLYLESSESIDNRFNLLQDCIKYIENLAGGPRPSNYSYTGGLTIK